MTGNNIYNTTAVNQTVNGSAVVGSSVEYYVLAQNDSGRSDRFRFVVSGPTVAGYSVKYLSGTDDRTSAITTGTFYTPFLATGSSYVVRVVVTIGAGAGPGSSLSRLITLVSASDPNKKDAVKLVTQRT